MTTYKLSCQIASSLQEVDRRVIQILEEMDEQVGAYDRFSMDLILREALNNAVVHGNQSNPDLCIYLSIMLVGPWFHIRIEDQGEGFDWTPKMLAEIQPELEHGRGLPIILHYGEEVKLNSKGNRISFKLSRHP